MSDLADYKTVAEADLFFNTGAATLSDADKAALSKLASDAAAIQNYMIEVAGYASSTGTRQRTSRSATSAHLSWRTIFATRPTFP